ncbi:Sushi/SCR/CCP domain [Trinorchestia longiramus]|nr:Sushi/SCR/CCP domain [Trinorchestia longiramus]
MGIKLQDLDSFHCSVAGTQPPAIVWQVARGGVSVVAGGGQLVLPPQSIVHLDCLYPRLSGNPNWSWTPKYRNYPTGWSISGSERDLHYRLSVYYAKHYDSGTFTCTTPTGHSNAITIEIKEMQCPDLVVPNSVAASQLQSVFGQRQMQGDSRIIVAGSGTTMGSSRFFTCFEGYALDGPEQMSCLPSATPPSCKVVRCPSLPVLPPMVQLRHLTMTAGGLAVFACPRSYALTAGPSIKCLTNGTWSAPIPHCEEVLCPMPESPEHGSVSAAALRRVGDVAIYSCEASYVLQGPSQVTCTNSGTWSKFIPKFLTFGLWGHLSGVVSCKSPGKPLNGRVSPRLLRYRLGAQLLVSCSPGYRPAGPDRLHCLRTGRWSAPLPPCEVRTSHLQHKEDSMLATVKGNAPGVLMVKQERLQTVSVVRNSTKRRQPNEETAVVAETCNAEANVG